MSVDFQYLRQQTVGCDVTFSTPFGERLIVYSDYTASGRCLHFIENHLQHIQRSYANTHTEDDVTGRSMTQLLHESEAYIKSAVNAGPDGRIVAAGTGATGAIDKLQQILGVACPPSTRNFLFDAIGDFMGEDQRRAFESFLSERRPIVFLGPYEHHSNEVSWREGIATVVNVELADDGSVDLDDLERLLKLPEYQNRLRIGSFSAASNVTGMRAPVQEISRLLHRHNALACFDYAASAPYVSIDMNPPILSDGDASIDAVYISPHKFLGGPGSSGILVFNERLYDKQLPPTIAAGGTVDYVGQSDHDFIGETEDREKPGTPGVLQTIKAALAFKVKQEASSERIEDREHRLLSGAMQRWKNNSNIEILGNADPERRIGIVSFNVKTNGGRHLHPKFVTVLLNDLFGIQSRAGCSCAGPYGHRLLNIDLLHSERYRQSIAEGHNGIKPGWCRVGFHYSMDDAEAEFIVDAVDFVASYGYRFLPLYRFDLASGDWQHRKAEPLRTTLSLADAMAAGGSEATAKPVAERKQLYSDYIRCAMEWAEKLALAEPMQEVLLDEKLVELQYFSIAAHTVGNL